MQALFTADYQWLWTIGLGLALLLPLRQLIWVLSVRRAESKDGALNDDSRHALKRRAGVTAALLSFIFAVVYMNNLFQGS